MSQSLVQTSLPSEPGAQVILPSHGTKFAAFTKSGIKNIDNKQNKIIGKNIFFEFIIKMNFLIILYLVPSPGFEPGTTGSKPVMISSFTTRANYLLNYIKFIEINQFLD